MSEVSTYLLHLMCFNSFDNDQISFLVQVIVDSISFDDDPSRFCPRSSGVLAIPFICVDMQKFVLNGLNQLNLVGLRQ